MQFQIRYAIEADLYALNLIYNQAVAKGGATADLYPVDLIERKRWFEKHGKQKNPVLVAEQEGQVVGWLSFSFYREGRPAVKQVREISYYIHEDFQRLGVASLLMDEAHRVSLSIGVEVLIAIIIDGNMGSIRMMEKYGFELWGRMPGIVQLANGKLRDHLIFGKHLPFDRR